MRNTLGPARADAASARLGVRFERLAMPLQSGVQYRSGRSWPAIERGSAEHGAGAVLAGPKTTQPSLFEQPAYATGSVAGFARGSDTSHEGAQLVNATLESRQAQVLAVIVQNGGATGFEIMDALGIESANLVSSRVRELVLQGLVEDSGERRVNPKSTVRCVVWRATNERRASC